MERLIKYQVVSDLPLNAALLEEVKTRMDFHLQVAACPTAASPFTSLAATHEGMMRPTISTLRTLLCGG